MLLALRHVQRRRLGILQHLRQSGEFLYTSFAPTQIRTTSISYSTTLTNPRPTNTTISLHPHWPWSDELRQLQAPHFQDRLRYLPLSNPALLKPLPLLLLHQSRAQHAAWRLRHLHNLLPETRHFATHFPRKRLQWLASLPSRPPHGYRWF